MTVLHWISSFFAGGIRDVAALVDKVRHAFSTIWHLLGNLGNVVSKAWRRFWHAVFGFVDDLVHFAAATWARLRWLVTVGLPRFARYAISAAHTAAVKLVNAVSAFAHAAYTAALHYAHRIVNTLEGWARATFRWVGQHLADAVNLLHRIARRVDALLTEPAKLALWLIGPLWRLILAQVQRDAKKIARYLLHHAATLILDSAHLIESALSDLL